MKNLKKLAAKLDDHGRGGDTIVAHINPREAALLKALGGSGTVNPKTGLLEFMDPMGTGSDYGSKNDGLGGPVGGDGGKDEGDRGRDAKDAAAPNAGPFGSSGGATPGYQGEAEIADHIAGGAKVAGRNEAAWGSAIGGLGRLAGRAVDNPAATATNMALGAVLGPAYTIGNAIYGGITGKDVGRGIVGGIANATGYNGPNAPTQTATDGRTAGPRGDGGPLSGNETGSYASGDGGGISRGNMALANALMGAPQSGIPANPFGRQTFGSLVNSYDPNGRQYVTPWAYRG